jgi:hypothetical protein
VSGQFRVTWTTGTSIAYAYRTASVTNAGLLVVVEANVYSGGNAIGGGIFFGTPTEVPFGDPGSSSYKFALIPRYPATTLQNWVLWAFGVSHAPFAGFGSTPQEGDKATIKITDLGGGQMRACYFVNDELIYEEKGAYAFSGAERYGYLSASFALGICDNYSIHIGNP